MEFKRSSGLLTLTVIGIVVASIGGYVGLSEYWSAQPSVSVQLVDVAFVPPKPIPPTTIEDRLGRIESTYRAHTGDKITSLLAQSGNIRDEDMRSSFAEELTVAIGFFEEEKKKEVDTLVLELKEVLDDLPKLDRETLLIRLGEVETKHEKVTGLLVIYLMSTVERQSDVEFNSHDQDALLKELVETYQGYSLVFEDLVSDLRELREDVNPTEGKKKNEGRLRVDVAVVNRSRYDNTLVTEAMIAVGRDENVHAIDLDISGDGKLTKYSMAQVVFHSRPAHEVDSEIRGFLADMTENAGGFQCEMAVMDIHRNIWSTGKQRCTNNNSAEMKKALELHFGFRVVL